MKNSKVAVKQGAKKLKILADEARLQILREIKDQGKTVSHLKTKLKIEQSLLSHHLKTLRDAGHVSSSRHGKFNIYKTSVDVLVQSAQHVVDLGCCILNFKDKQIQTGV